MSAFIGYFVIVSGIFAYRNQTAKWRTFRIIAGAVYFLFLLLGAAALSIETPYYGMGVVVMNIVLGGIVYLIWGKIVRDRKAAAATAGK
jgi:hypothetical protein